MELRADMVNQAKDDVKAASEQASVEMNVQRMIEKQTKNLQVSLMFGFAVIFLVLLLHCVGITSIAR